MAAIEVGEAVVELVPERVGDGQGGEALRGDAGVALAVGDVVERLGVGVVGEDGQRLDAALAGDLQRVVVAVEVLGALADAAVWRGAGGRGTDRGMPLKARRWSVESVLPGIVDGGVELCSLSLVAGLRADVSDAAEEVFGELVFDGEVVVIGTGASMRELARGS